MIFDDMPLWFAIHKVYIVLKKPGAEDWLDDPRKIYGLVLEKLAVDGLETIPWSRRRALAAWKAYRKSKKIRFTCKVGLLHGIRCPYANRGLGKCSADVQVDRIRPGARGGKYTLETCWIACGKHNGGRGCQYIEDYINPSSSGPTLNLTDPGNPLFPGMSDAI